MRREKKLIEIKLSNLENMLLMLFLLLFFFTINYRLLYLEFEVRSDGEQLSTTVNLNYVRCDVCVCVLINNT